MTSLSHATDRYLGKLQPMSIPDLVGQQKLTKSLKRLTRMAGRGEQSFPPLLLVGKRGVGKRAIATATARQLADRNGAGVCRVKAESLSALHRVEGRLSDLDDGDVVIAEQIHRLEPSIRNYLLQAAAQRTRSVAIHQESEGEDSELSLPAFTLLATAAPEITGVPTSKWNPIRVRDYNTEELVAMARWCADRVEVEISDAAAFLLARHSRGHSRLLKEMFVHVLLDSVEAMSHRGCWRIEESMVNEAIDVDD